MRILIIAEARTGGTTLIDYFEKVFTEYEIVTEPYTNLKDWIETNDITNVDWYKKKDNVIVKEIFDGEYNFKNFIDSSDKVICIYRKNWFEQTRSVLYAENGDTFLHNYNIEDVNKVITEEMIYKRYLHRIRNLKKSFMDFIESNNLLSVSYEDLYYEDGIDIIKKYINIESEISFPPTKKYLKNIDGIEFGPNNIKNYNEDYLNFLEIEYVKGYSYREPKIIKGKPNKLI
jgi:hypothetical protein